MRRPTVVQPETFLETAVAIGLKPEHLKHIERSISNGPFMGHAYVDIPNAPPMSAFIGRSWKFPRPNGKLGGAMLEVTTLHLHIGKDRPVYMFDVVELPEYATPWNNEAQKRLLIVLALPITEAWHATVPLES